MRVAARRDGSQRTAVTRVLQHAGDGRPTVKVFPRVGDKFRESVGNAHLGAVREASPQINLRGVVPALPIAFQTIVDIPVVREWPERLCDGTGQKTRGQS